MIGGAHLTVDLEALAANYRLIAARVAPAQVGGVVKADGYGLGAARVARRLIAEGCQHLFVALLGEAAALIPEIGDGPSVYVLNGLLPGDEALCAELGAVPVLNALDQIARWAALARGLGRVLPAVVQCDTGMSRMGLAPDEAEALLADPALLAGLDVRFVISHLACADVPGHPANALQHQRFAALAARFGGCAPGAMAALDNSGGSFHAHDHFGLVRAGIALYGGAPAADAPNPMAPVIALEARIAQLRSIPAGAGVGYGLTFTATRETRIATIPVGYADGLPRSLSNRGAGWIGGHRAPIAGRVSMDSITLDVTDVPAALLYPGAPVELIGPHQSLDQLAEDASTIAYEILTQLSRRYQRSYGAIGSIAI